MSAWHFHLTATNRFKAKWIWFMCTGWWRAARKQWFPSSARLRCKVLIYDFTPLPPHLHQMCCANIDCKQSTFRPSTIKTLSPVLPPLSGVSRRDGTPGLTGTSRSSGKEHKTTTMSCGNNMLHLASALSDAVCLGVIRFYGVSSPCAHLFGSLMDRYLKS